MLAPQPLFFCPSLLLTFRDAFFAFFRLGAAGGSAVEATTAFARTDRMFALGAGARFGAAAWAFVWGQGLTIVSKPDFAQFSTRRMLARRARFHAPFPRMAVVGADAERASEPVSAITFFNKFFKALGDFFDRFKFGTHDDTVP